MTVFRKIFNGFEKVDSPTFQQVRYYINGNFSKAIKLLIAIYGKTCCVCGYLSPNFETDSGVANHYYCRHRDDTIVFIQEKLMVKSQDEIEEMIDHELDELDGNEMQRGMK